MLINAFFIFGLLNQMDFKLKKIERLYQKKEIESLFKDGKSMLVHPFKVVYLLNQENSETDNYPIKVAISIPKKKFKKAVDRNLLKRRTKEAYRLNRNQLKEELLKENHSLKLLLIYLDKNELPYKVIEDKIILILQRLQAVHEETFQ